jgi:2-oxoglutarate dehydrogenase E2 component (dihydrolipoamide succinyltransferase)
MDQKKNPHPRSPNQNPKQVMVHLLAIEKNVVSVSSNLFLALAVLIDFQVKMNRMRLRIAERLKQSQNTAASLTTFNEVDMSSLMEFRKLYKDDVLKRTGVKLGFMSAFSRACVLAMKEVPAVNASIEGPNGGDTIVYRDYVDISIAVATEKGLVTPVVRNAESLDMISIEKAIAELGKKVRSDAFE